MPKSGMKAGLSEDLDNEMPTSEMKAGLSEDLDHKMSQVWHVDKPLILSVNNTTRRVPEVTLYSSIHEYLKAETKKCPQH